MVKNSIRSNGTFNVIILQYITVTGEKTNQQEIHRIVW